MKFRMWMAMLLAALLPACALAQEAAETMPVDYETVYGDVLQAFYGDVLQAFYETVHNGSQEYDDLGGFVGVMEIAAGRSGEEASESVGYCIEDINGDGAAELLIGEIAPAAEKEGAFAATRLCAVYTWVDGEAVCAAEGWARSRYYLMADGSLYYEGSASAFEAAFGRYALEGAVLTCKDFYFTAMGDEDSGALAVHYNTQSAWDASVSEKADMVAFQQDTMEWMAQSVAVNLTPFAQYGFAGQDVRAQWAEDVLSELTQYSVFIAERTEYSAQVVFSSAVGAADFRVLALTMENVSEEGEILFSAEELYRLDELSADCPLLVETTFYGTIPNVGIAYTDASGAQKYLSVSVSGMDGSLILSDIEISGK